MDAELVHRVQCEVDVRVGHVVGTVDTMVVNVVDPRHNSKARCVREREAILGIAPRIDVDWERSTATAVSNVENAWVSERNANGCCCGNRSLGSEEHCKGDQAKACCACHLTKQRPTTRGSGRPPECTGVKGG